MAQVLENQKSRQLEAESSPALQARRVLRKPKAGRKADGTYMHHLVHHQPLHHSDERLDRLDRATRPLKASSLPACRLLATSPEFSPIAQLHWATNYLTRCIITSEGPAISSITQVIRYYRLNPAQSQAHSRFASRIYRKSARGESVGFRHFA